jgi:Uma2 family endonuclease
MPLALPSCRMTPVATLPAMTTQFRGPRLRRWTYAEYERLGGLGFFRNQHVQLIEGKIVKMAPQLDLHAAAVGLAQRAIERVFPADSFWVRPQLPLQIGRWSGPEPDISVVPGNPRDYIGTGHPRSALLLVEVSDTTLRLDRGRKAALYAKAGILDYWIVNLVDRRVEIYRQPIADKASRVGHRYADIRPIAVPEKIAPLAAPQATVAVSDLLP